MTHLSEPELLDAYYEDLPEAGWQHLRDCLECRAAFARISELLDEVRTAPIPERTEGYGREVWARLEPHLEARKPHWWRRPWFFAPAAAALLVIAFIAGMLTMRSRQNPGSQQLAGAHQAGISGPDQQRVFLSAMSDHLERSEILLAQLLNASPAEENISDERGRARDLLDENRLLRETASRSGDHAHAALLDDLERVFLDLANSPGQLSADDVAELQRRIASQGLLFKVRVTDTETRRKGPQL